MKRAMRSVVVVIVSSVVWAQSVPNSARADDATKEQTLADVIDGVKAVSPNSAVNLILTRQVLTQEPVTGSGFLRNKTEPLRIKAFQSLLDYTTIVLCADLLAVKATRPQAAKDAMSGLGGRAGERFDATEIKDIPWSGPVSFRSDVFLALRGLLSGVDDWPSLSTLSANAQDGDTQALEGVSPKAVKDILMARELVKQIPMKTGNTKVDAEIAEAKKLAVENMTNLAWIELFSDLLIARESESKNVAAALKVISGPKYATDKAAFDFVFGQEVQVGPKLGSVTLQTWNWLGPETNSTVVRLIGGTSE